MKKVFAVLVVLVVALGAFALPVMAQDASMEAPNGTWFGTWAYSAPGTHHLSGFAAGGQNDNLGNLFRPMVELQPAYYLWATGEYVGLLAESWGFTDDNAAYEFTIKEGATWSNGDPITSQDVLDTYAIGRMLNWSQFNSVESVEAVDERTTRFNFREGQASLLAERLILKEYISASATYGELAQRAREVYETGATREDAAWGEVVTAIAEFRPTELIASGPYTYSLADVGEAFMTLRWQPNSLYSGTVNFDELKIWSGETEVTTPLVLSGELAHSTNVYPPATVDAFAAQSIRLITIPRGYGPALLFNFRVAPFDNVLVRQAMTHAIDREQSALLTNGLGAAGTVNMSGVLDSLTSVVFGEGDVDGLNRYEFDLDGAAALMEEAGYTRNAAGLWADDAGNTIDVEYVFPADFADFSAAARDATAQLNDFGFNITERALPWQEARDAIINGDFDLSVWSWGAGAPFAFQNFNNPVRRWSIQLAEGQPGTGQPLTVELDGETFDLNQEIVNVNSGLDAEAHRERSVRIAQVLNEGAYFIPLNEMLSVEPMNETYITGVPADGDPIYSNPANEHPVIYLLLNGVLAPTDAAQ